MRKDGFELNDVIGSSIGRLPRDGRLPDEGTPAEIAEAHMELWGAEEVPLVCGGYLPLEIQQELAIRDERSES